MAAIISACLSSQGRAGAESNEQPHEETEQARRDALDQEDPDDTTNNYTHRFRQPSASPSNRSARIRSRLRNGLFAVRGTLGTAAASLTCSCRDHQVRLYISDSTTPG